MQDGEGLLTQEREREMKHESYNGLAVKSVEFAMSMTLLSALLKCIKLLLIFQ
jgi:hypothetical protein